MKQKTLYKLTQTVVIFTIIIVFLAGLNILLNDAVNEINFGIMWVLLIAFMILTHQTNKLAHEAIELNKEVIRDCKNYVHLLEEFHATTERTAKKQADKTHKKS